MTADMLGKNPNLFLAYNHSSEIMEVYEVRTTPDSGAGICALSMLMHEPQMIWHMS